MLIDLTAWPCGPIEGNARTICGQRVHFQLLPIRERFDLGSELVTVLKRAANAPDALTLLQDDEILGLIDRLCQQSDAPEALFDADLTAQIPVAMTAAEINLAGYFDEKRMSLAESTHKAVRRAMKKDSLPETKKIAPDVEKYWFLWRPVMAEVCSFDAMFIEERYSFADIHRMHEMLDLKTYQEIVASHVED